MSGGSITKLRAARTRAGKCAVCLKRRCRAGRTTCWACADANAVYTKTRYHERRAGKRCTKCDAPVKVDPVTGRVPYLCPDDAAARRKRRAS